MDFFKCPYLIAAWVIHQLMGAGMQRLASVDRVQDHLVTYDHLERKEQQSFAKGRMGVHRLRCMVVGGHLSRMYSFYKPTRASMACVLKDG